MKQLPVLANMSKASQDPARATKAIWVIIGAFVFVGVCIMALQTILRLLFPWDTYFWSESPFLTNMLKLDHHLPIYGPPADANSFVYSPGLEYLCYAILKPAGWELDIRFCRAVSIGLGMLGALCAALAMSKVAGPPKNREARWVRFFLGFGVVLLVLAKNFMWDICHPDNLHAFHALSVFCLCFAAVETRRFGLAVATMIWAGVGVFTKQTDALCFLGPAIIFAHYDPWGWRRYIAVAAVGAASAAVAIFLLWRPQYARFYTYELLTHQRMQFFEKLPAMMMDLNIKDRGLLLYLSLIGGVYLWGESEKSRRYMVCWLGTGIFSALPNLLAYTKVLGATNNLTVFEVWLALIVWPFFLKCFDRVEQAKSFPESAEPRIWGLPAMPTGVCLLMMVLVMLLEPSKHVPGGEYYQYCQNIEDAVRRDHQAGLKILMPHGTEYLIRAGLTNVPLDRCNSVLELDAGGVESSGTESRIHSHYYDRIYLVMGGWYGEKIRQEMRQNYVMEKVISGPTAYANVPYDSYDILRYGFQPGLMGDCLVMVPRRDADVNQPH